MTTATPEQTEAAERLGVPLTFSDAPLAIAKLVQLVQELQQRVAVLENGGKRKGRGWSG